MRTLRAGAPGPPRTAARAFRRLAVLLGWTILAASLLHADEPKPETPPACADRCEAKLVRITVGDLVKVVVYNNDGKVVTDAKPIVATDSPVVKQLLKNAIDPMEQPVPLKGKGCEKGCRCVVDPKDANLKWIENPGNFTITVEWRHIGGRDVWTFKIKREVAIGSGICDIEPPR